MLISILTTILLQTLTISTICSILFLPLPARVPPLSPLCACGWRQKVIWAKRSCTRCSAASRRIRCLSMRAAALRCAWSTTGCGRERPMWSKSCCWATTSEWLRLKVTNLLSEIALEFFVCELCTIDCFRWLCLARWPNWNALKPTSN